MSTSFWAVGTELSRPPLDLDTSCDVCVIGAGIAGLSVAYQLAAEGRTVIVIDADTPGGGETGRTTPHLMTAFDDCYVEVERHLGAEAARLVAESHAVAIKRTEAICRAKAIDCGLERVTAWSLILPALPCTALHCTALHCTGPRRSAIWTYP
ncbi:FAD-binding oxidoreductase [Cupriavidus necator]|uniref:FAD-dependent oxidoreductase n=1 Tax=Cupriavidus necator TaxID=106590 RepID=UPI003ECC7DD3